MKAILPVVAAIALVGTIAHAQEVQNPAPVTQYGGAMDRRFEAGLVLGEPTGASLKYWFNDTLAVDSALGWSFHRETDLYLHGDVLWHKFDLFRVPEGELPLYFGVGARVKFRDNNDDRVGIRLPVGVTYLFANTPVSLFIEVAPIIDFTPSTQGGFTAGIGARYRF